MAYVLSKSTINPIWRSSDPGALMPEKVKPGLVTDAIARKLTACAQKRWDMLKPTPPATDYSKLMVSDQNLKGLCYIVADEFETYFRAQGIDARAVKVVPKSGTGGDHYFTVVNMGSAKTSLIVDATWRQFAGGAANPLPYCLCGTLEILNTALPLANSSDDIAGMYAAGLTVLKQWKGYSCFP